MQANLLSLHHASLLVKVYTNIYFLWKYFLTGTIWNTTDNESFLMFKQYLRLFTLMQVPQANHQLNHVADFSQYSVLLSICVLDYPVPGYERQKTWFALD